jgi:hypothetical protein
MRGRCHWHPRCCLQRVCVLHLYVALSCPISLRACTPARSATAPSRHLPLSLLAQAHVASMQYMTIEGGHLYMSSATASCPPLVSRRCRIAPIFSAISSVPSCLTPPPSPCAGPKVAPRLAQVHLPSTALVSIHFLVARLPSCE